ncbi:MAG: Ig-like domain repeat protein [Proteobacteria bacterium]|nr:Ig-like domain repeat protein [Pseudomonadota bacterium]
MKKIQNTTILTLTGTLVLLASCSYKADFKGSAATKQAMDAVYGRGAQLANLPSNPTNVSSIDVKVFGEGLTKYIYSIVEADQLCQAASYSAVMPIATSIATDVGAEGTKKLCVKGSADDTTFQSKATEFVWTIDKTPPQSFSLTGLQAAMKSNISQLAWSESLGASTYEITVGSSPDCKSTSLQTISTSSLTSAINPVKDGSYYVCAISKDLAGNQTTASNSPFKLLIDATPSGKFHIYEPLSLINSTLPKIKWSASTDAVSYSVIVSNDASCVSNVETKRLLSSPEMQMSISLQDAHTYYVCASAFDQMGHETKADNNGYAFTVDTTGLMISFANLPLPNSQAVTPQIQVTSLSTDFAAFRYAMGPASLNCALESNYSAPIAAGSSIPVATLTSPDGLHKVCAIGGDRAGNWMNPAAVGGFISYQWRKDTAGPALAFTVPAVCGPNVCGGVSVPNIPITNYASSDTGSGLDKVEVVITHLSTTVYPVTAAGLVLPKALFAGRSGTYSINAIATDKSGNVTTVSKPFIWDEVAPVLSSLSLIGKPIVSKPFASADLIATEAHSGIKDICFKSTIIVANVTIPNTTPNETDNCWVSAISLNAASLGRSAAASRVPYVVGFIGPESYLGQAWIRDGALNVSGIKSDTIRYEPGAVPELTDVIAASTNTPSNPLSVSDRTISSVATGNKLFIKWIAKDSDKNLPTNPISLYYTHDETTWTPIVENIAADNAASCTPKTISPIPSAPLREKSGCYVWATNLSQGLTGYTKIRVAIKDSDDQVTYSTAPIINLPQLNFLAGNTETGIGASARSTIFQNDVGSAGDQDPGSLLVTSKGEIIFRDYRRGIFKVSADTGSLELIIKNNVSAARVDAETPLAASFLKSPIAIALDYQDRILVLENDRLRRIDLAKETIESIAGHGANLTDGDTGVTADNVKIRVSDDRSSRVLYAMPNNKIVFVSNTSFSSPTSNQPAPMQRLRVLDLNSPTKAITNIKFSGTFDFDTVDKNFDVQNCRVWNMAVGFDKSTGAYNAAVVNLMGNKIEGTNVNQFWQDCDVDRNYKVKFMAVNPSNMTVDSSTNLNTEAYLWGSSSVGMDGQIYHFDRSFGEIHKYNPTIKKFEKIVGSTQVRAPGVCADNTHPLSCAIDPLDVFVSPDGRLFFMDRGRLRTIQGTGSAAKVVTIMGQSYGYGNGENALSARFGIVNSFARWKDNTINKDKIVILDGLEQVFRESVVGGNISHVAGNGTSTDLIAGATAANAQDQGIKVDRAGRTTDNFALRPNGAIIFRSDDHFVELNRQTNKWIKFAGDSSKTTTWRDAGDGTTGFNLKLKTIGAYPHLLGLDTSGATPKLLFASTFYDFNLGSSVASQDAFLMTFSLNSTNSANSPAIFNRIAGKTGPSRRTAAEFDAGTSCFDLPALDCPLVSSYTQDYMSATPVSSASGTAWIYAHQGSNKLLKVDTDGKLKVYQQLNFPTKAFAIKRGLTEADDTVFYCSTSGALKKRHLGIESDLSLGLTSANRMLCYGRQMQFDAATNKLTFIYIQNGLNGIAEYSVP